MPNNRVSGTQSVDRAVDLLLAVANAGEGVRMTDLAKTCGLSVGTAHRLLQALARRGLVEIAPDSKRMVLGLQLFRLAGQAAQSGATIGAAGRQRDGGLRFPDAKVRL